MRPIAADRLAALGALADDLHVGVLGQQGPEPGARQRLVVHDQGADRGAVTTGLRREAEREGRARRSPRRAAAARSAKPLGAP